MSRNFDIYTSAYPALKADKKLIITEKNEAASTRMSPFRRGSSLRNYLSSLDCNKLLSLMEGEMTTVSIVAMSMVPAMVYSTCDGYIMKTSVLPIMLEQRLSELITLQEANMYTLTPLNKMCDFTFPDTATVKKAFALQSNINSYFKILCGMHSKETKVGYVGLFLKEVCEISRQSLHCINIRLSLHLPEFQVNVKFSPTDICMILFTAISTSVLMSGNSRVDVRMITTSSGEYIEIITERGLSAEAVSCICDDQFESHSFLGENGEIRFTLAYLRRLCEHYHFRFTLSLLSGKGCQQMTVFLPRCNEEPSFTMSDSHSLRSETKLIAAVALAPVISKPASPDSQSHKSEFS